MRTKSLSAFLTSLAVALAACGDDGASETTAASATGSGGDDASSSTRGAGQGGEGTGGDPSGVTGSTGSSPTTGTQSGGGDGGSSSSGLGGNPASGGGDPGSGGNGGETGAGGEGGEGGSPPECSAGVIRCEGTLQRVCDGFGGFTDTECAPGGCIPGVGCVACQPDTATCNGNTSSVCRSDGSGFDVYECDPVQGSICDVGSGHCTGACSPEELEESYIGCDYYATVTKNDLLDGSFTFSIAVANTSNEEATITITRGGAAVATEVVAAQSVRIIGLPWVDELRLASSSTLVADGAYRVRTTQPVTVYQYNPLQYTLGGGFNSFTNDASLLLPTNAWTGNYRVASFNAFYLWSGFYAVTAREDGTTVTVSPSASGASILQGGGLPANGAGTVVLNEGDVLQVLSSFDGSIAKQAYDLTGTLVAADKPVEVFGGHNCLYLPADTGYCDHLEEAMPPIETLSTEYIVTPPEWSGGGPDLQWVRIIATEANTNLTFDPPLGVGTNIANAGELIEVESSAVDFAVTSDRPILVSQYMRGQGDSPALTGDPAMALAVATEQYRDEYLFHAPTNYTLNFVNITAPTGASIVLDGVAVAGFTPVGASGYSVARVPLSNAGDGNHTVTGSEPFGISVYGYGDDTSYWYPGGLDLEQVN